MRCAVSGVRSSRTRPRASRWSRTDAGRDAVRAWSNFEFRDSLGRWHEVDLLFLEFSDALPDDLAATTVATRLADPAGAAQVLRGKARFSVE